MVNLWLGLSTKIKHLKMVWLPQTQLDMFKTLVQKHPVFLVFNSAFLLFAALTITYMWNLQCGLQKLTSPTFILPTELRNNRFYHKKISKSSKLWKSINPFTFRFSGLPGHPESSLKLCKEEDVERVNDGQRKIEWGRLCKLISIYVLKITILTSAYLIRNKISLQIINHTDAVWEIALLCSIEENMKLTLFIGSSCPWDDSWESQFSLWIKSLSHFLSSKLLPF